MAFAHRETKLPPPYAAGDVRVPRGEAAAVTDEQSNHLDKNQAARVGARMHLVLQGLRYKVGRGACLAAAVSLAHGCASEPCTVPNTSVEYSVYGSTTGDCYAALAAGTDAASCCTPGYVVVAQDEDSVECAQSCEAAGVSD